MNTESLRLTLYKSNSSNFVGTNGKYGAYI